MSDQAHYNRHVEFEPDRIFGPDTCGAHYKMVSVAHHENGTSTVQFKPYLGDLVVQE